MEQEEQRCEALIDTLVRETGARRQDVRLARSPLRVCPLGAHVDHQLGLVTGMTMDEAILLAYLPEREPRVRVRSLNFSPPVDFPLDDVPPRGEPAWANYLRGAVVALQRKYPLRHGITGVIGGWMPIGGLSSSAAAGVAYLLALEDVNGLEVSPEENILLDQYIENVYIGLNNGILDQSVILLSNPGHLTYVDCQTMGFDRIPSAEDLAEFDIVVVYSGLSKTLVSTDYNQRVAQCQEAAAFMLAWAGLPVPAEPKLRLVPEEVFREYGDRLPQPLGRRATHFFTEVARVRAGVEAWRRGDLGHFGELMRASGESSIHNYECGAPHLIEIFDILNQCPGVYGSRFSGAGFRGSCIGLSDPAAREIIREAVEARYPARFPEMKDKFGVFFCRPGGSAGIKRRA